MGKMSRTKGASGERLAVNMARDCGLDARRTAPNQTQDGDSEFADVRIIGKDGTEYRVECKWYKQFKTSLWDLLHGPEFITWLDGNDVLFMRQNGQTEPLAVMSFALADPLMDNADYYKYHWYDDHWSVDINIGGETITAMKYTDWLELIGGVHKAGE